MRTLVTSLLLGAIGTLAHAQDRGERQARYALDLFKAACVSSFGIEKRVGAWAEANSVAELAPESARTYLRGKAGRIWMFVTDLGKFTLISQEGGNCTVQAERAKASSLKEFYTVFLSELPPDFKTTMVQEDNRATPMGVLYTIVQDSDSERSGIVLRTLLSTSESESAYVQGLLTLQARRR
jgi:hypothetical protein